MSEFDNHSIASTLDDMGDLLEVSGGDKFRVLSWHKAAGVIRAWPEDVASMAREERLKEIPGVGPKIGLAITQLVQTGTFDEFERLKEDFEVSLIELTKVSGVGPKRAKVLRDELGVSTITDLEAALATGKVAGLPRFGDKTAASMAAGLEEYHRHHERILLSDALPLADRLVGELERLPEVSQARYAGSLRRMQETIGDIDILTSSSEPKMVMEAVCRLPAVTRVLGTGETKTSVLTTEGLQADVRVVAPHEWGAALQYFTGDKAHNVHLRALAKERGLKISEYGVFLVKTGERIAGDTEEEVYDALGMDTPPPEIRGDCGEIEAALEHRLPRLVELRDVRGDFHSHTTYTDGRSRLAGNKAVAAALGYEFLAATDHAFDLRMVGGLDEEKLRRQWREIDALNAEGGPRILKGIELNIGDDGTVDYDERVLACFDVCVASLHSGFGQPRDVTTGRLLKAMDNPFVDIIGHPTGRILGRRDPLKLDMEAVLEKAGRTGTLMEINSYPDRLDLCDSHIRMARRCGVRFSLGTDAHQAEQLRFMPYGVATARRGWVVADELLNAQPWEVARGWLKHDRARRGVR